MAFSYFDELTKALAVSTSRRQTFRVLLASVLGGTLGISGRGTTLADGVDRFLSTPDCGDRSDPDKTWQHIYKCLYQGMTKECYAGGYDPTGKRQWVLGLNQGQPNNYTFFAGERIKGIECHLLWTQKDPDYWTIAWQVANKNPSQPQYNLKKQINNGTLGMAINSQAARNLEQFHIHLSCIQPDVLKILNNRTDIPTTPSGWTSTKAMVTLPIHPPTAHRDHADFRVLRLSLGPGLTYHKQNLFQLLYSNIIASQHRPQSDMQYQTLVVAQAPGKQFYIINSEDEGHQYLPDGIGAGERLLNENC